MYGQRVPFAVLDDARLVAKARGIERGRGRTKGGIGSLLFDMSINEVMAEAQRLRRELGVA